MSLQLTSNDWLLKLDTEVQGNASKFLLGQFTSSFVLISIQSDSALPVWKSGGTVSQAVTTPAGIAYSTRQNLALAELNLISFLPIAGGSYQLYYFPLLRLETVRLQVWEYQGTTKDLAIEELITALSSSSILTANFTRLHLFKLRRIAGGSDRILASTSMQMGLDHLVVSSWILADSLSLKLP